jgi:hypothetical protein
MCLWIFEILTVLCSISEIVPVNKRGVYLAIATGSIIPFSPYILYAQYWSFYATWRWRMWITAYAFSKPFEFGQLCLLALGLLMSLAHCSSTSRRERTMLRRRAIFLKEWATLVPFYP